MSIRKKIIEAKDVSIYKKLLKVLGDYSTSFPATGVTGLFDVAIEQGKKILPNDKQALDIIDCLLSDESNPAAVQKFLNCRFSDLPIEYRPISKKGNKHEVASWERNGIVSDRAKALIDFGVVGKKGKWSDIDGQSVTLVDISKEE